jgi:prepilin-type N-terminal cleavage/methylation domain-containing protein
MKRIGRHNIHHRHGFTLIEMVMVLIVMAIMGTVLVSRATMEGNDLIAQTDILKSHLRHAQIRAMNDTFPWGIHIPDNGSYELYRANALAATVLLPGETAQRHTFPAGITVTAGVGSTYNFNEWGIPVDTGAPPAAVGTRAITLTRGTTNGSITITKNTGYIP